LGKKTGHLGLVITGEYLIAMSLFIAACAKPPVPQEPVPPPPFLTPPPILSPFGQRSDGPHYGVDIRVPVGTPVLAAAPGDVFWTGQGEISGKAIILRHDEALATFYFHLSRVDVKKGDLVKRGQVIGLSGKTGNATTPHLHFAVCRAPNADCRRKIPQGWVNPVAFWEDVENPCFYPTPNESLPLHRLTYPVPCHAS
jgi:murein DD-endopeptidase MepM/ murein hydrolase activator NlpD